MYAVMITDEGGVRRRLDFTKPELTVGRVHGNDIVLAKRNVSKQHARLVLKDEQPVVADLNSTNGTWVNGRKITSPYALKHGDKIYIADFIITVEPANDGADHPSPEQLVSEPPPVPSRSALPIRSSKPIRPSTAARRGLETEVPPRSPPPKDIRGTSLPPRIERRQTNDAVPTPTSDAGAVDPLTALLSRLGERIDLDDINPAAMKDQERWSATRAAIADTFLAMQNEGWEDADVDMRQVAHIALHEAVGLGALDDLLSDETVQTVVVNGIDRIFLDRGEGLEAADLKFSSDAALMRVARRLAAQAGESLEAHPVLHGRLSFGPKLTILQSPLVMKGPVIELRISASKSLEELAEDGWMSPGAATYLAKAVAECRNIVVAGARGAGVTELLSALARELPATESVVTVEAVPELDVDRDRVVSFAAADAGISMTDAIEHGTRLHADRLVMSDLSGASAVAGFSALLGREPGNLLGVYSFSSKDPVEGVVLAAGGSGMERGQVAKLVGSAVDLVVAMQRGPEGRKVIAVLEVQGHEGGDVSYQSVPF
mgnify:CR=1 FL=1